MSKSKSKYIEYVLLIECCKNKNELKSILSIVREKIKNNRSFSFFLIKNRIVSEKIIELMYLYNNSIKESVFRLLNNIEHDVVCQCGNRCRFLDNNRGYQLFCGSQKCEFINKKKNETSIKTFLIKYGMHPMRTEVVKDRLKKSFIEKYGVDSPMKIDMVKDKIKKTNLEKYGFDHAMKSSEVKLKTKNTNFERYGGHPMQSDDTFLNNLKSRVKFKEYTMPSGKKIQIQGYEKFGIIYLIDKYLEQDILTSVKEINKEIGIIRYNYNNKNRRYYPDFFIRKENKIYEVKSIWTYNANIEKNILKKEACNLLGISFEFLVFDYRGNRILI